MCYNGGTVDLLIASAFSLTLFSLLCNDKKQLPFTLLLIVSATLLFNYQQSINSEWSLLLMAGLMMGFAVFWFFSTPSLQQMWLALRWAAIIPILLTSLLGIWHYLVTLKPIDAQMLDANVFAITQYLGFFLLLSLPAPIKRSEMLVRTLALFLLMFAFFATYSRSGMGAWLGSFGGIVVLSLIKPLFSKRYLLSIVGVTLLAAMVLARTVYLARALGYLKRPMLAPRRSVLAVPIVLVFLTSAVTVLGVSRKAFMEAGSLPVPASWVKSTDFAQSVLTLDPDNQAAKVFLFNQLLFRLEAAPTDQQQQVFELAYGLGEQALADYPFDSDYHWRQGLLLQTAMEIGLDTSIAKDLSPEAFINKHSPLTPAIYWPIQACWICFWPKARWIKPRNLSLKQNDGSVSF